LIAEDTVHPFGNYVFVEFLLQSLSFSLTQHMQAISLGTSENT